MKNWFIFPCAWTSIKKLTEGIHSRLTHQSSLRIIGRDRVVQDRTLWVGNILQWWNSILHNVITFFEWDEAVLWNVGFVWGEGLHYSKFWTTKMLQLLSLQDPSGRHWCEAQNLVQSRRPPLYLYLMDWAKINHNLKRAYTFFFEICLILLEWPLIYVRVFTRGDNTTQLKGKDLSSKEMNYTAKKNVWRKSQREKETNYTVLYQSHVGIRMAYRFSSSSWRQVDSKVLLVKGGEGESSKILWFEQLQKKKKINMFANHYKNQEDVNINV